jgi:hypothetical protein
MNRNDIINDLCNKFIYNYGSEWDYDNKCDPRRHAERLTVKWRERYGYESAIPSIWEIASERAKELKLI